MADPRFVGRSYEAPVFEVSADSIREFRRATGNQDEPLAPPTYAMVYDHGVYEQVMRDEEIGINVARLVHGEQGFTYHRPVRPGDRITSTGRISEITTRGPLELITVEVTARDAQGRPVSEATARFVIRNQ